MHQARSRRSWDLMNTSYDKFIRTTDEDHEAQVKRIFKNCTIREIFTKELTKECTVLRVSLSGQSLS